MQNERSELRDLEPMGRVLLRAEETIALVARATPENAISEISRLSADLERGRVARPRFAYAERPDLSALRRDLEALWRVLGEAGRLAALYAERAEELALEAELAEHVGTLRFSGLASKRFALPTHSELLDAFVRKALADADDRDDGRLYASDDGASPESLAGQLRRLAAELALPLRVEIHKAQLATAATGRGLVAVRPGVMLSAATARRIAHHELLAHALPRTRSEFAPLSLLRAGSAGSAEHEEGRALLIEHRMGLLGPGRRRELARRHVAASAVRRGADFAETVRELVACGTGATQSLEIATRVHRGGGLAREIVYLPSYFQVSEAFALEPALEPWFERGRVAIGAARELQALVPPEPGAIRSRSREAESQRGIASSARR